MNGNEGSNFAVVSFQAASHPYILGSQANPCGICVGQSSTGTRFPRLSRFPLSVLLDQCITFLLSTIYVVYLQASESVLRYEELAFFLAVTDMCARCTENPAIIQHPIGTYASAGIAARTCTGRNYLLSSGSACFMKMCR